YWRAGATLSWIAYRDRRMICQFEDYPDWQGAMRYGHAAWKVDNPGAEMIRALQDDRLRAIVRKDSELPAVLPPEFWARKRVKDPFMIGPDVRREEVLQLGRIRPADRRGLNRP